MKYGNVPRWFRYIAVICGFVLMCYGIARGEMAIVLQKATNICLECIGIG